MAGLHFQRATLKLSVAETTQWRHFFQKKIKEKLITALNYSGRSVIFISDPLYKVLVEPSDKNVQQNVINGNSATAQLLLSGQQLSKYFQSIILTLY